MVDFNWIDAGTFLVALAHAVLQYIRRPPPKSFISGETRKRFMDGTALFPLAVLTLSLFSSRLTSDLLHSNKLILSVAGFVALFAVLES